jgi:hypothetical protein
MRPGAAGDAMNAAALRARVERLGELIDGLGKEAEAVLADRGDLPLIQWSRYLTAINNAKAGLRAARSALREALAEQHAGPAG